MLSSEVEGHRNGGRVSGRLPGPGNRSTVMLGEEQCGRGDGVGTAGMDACECIKR